ncbi:DUF2586 family protein (plasmid) [Paenibacillus sp. EC2-1]|uniref:DUF2586 family protein n=1 Tax=Paenibacillus sp. EC2-1 TaxID=3388665 RepID=UPI003BEEFE1B
MANFQDEYGNLPGHNIQFRDGNLNLPNDANPADTESILFLGTATDGPVYQPVRVTPDNASLFGRMTHPNGVANGATLLSAFEEAWNAGARDIRLMRISGKVAKSQLRGASRTKTVEHIVTKVVGVSQGNAAQTVTLPHGGIDLSSLVISANGVILPTSTYTAEAGTEENLQTSEPGVKATVEFKENIADMEADVIVSYDYAYVDAEGEAGVSQADTNVDETGQPIVLAGAPKAFNLDHQPKTGLKLYIEGSEITNPSTPMQPIFIVNAVGKTVTINSTDKIARGLTVEVSYAYDEVVVETPTIELESVNGGNVYNQMTNDVTIENGISKVTIVKPDSKKALMSEAPMTFASTNYPSFQLLVNAINSHRDNGGTVRAYTNFPDELTSTLEVKPTTFFSGGNDEIGLSKEELYKRLGGETDAEGYVTTQGAYQLLENYTVDYIVPIGVHADDKLIGKHDNFAYQLALACAVISHYNSVTMGLISTSSPSDISLRGVQEHVNKLLTLENNYYMRDRFGNEIKDGEGNRIDLGQYIHINAGPDVIVSNTRIGLTASNNGAAYLGMVSKLPTQSAPTNKIIPNALSLRYEYSQAQLNKLTEARFLTLKYKNNKQNVAVVDAMTAAHVGSDYTRVSTARIVKEACNIIREVADPYIGEPNDAANRNALTAAIAKELDKMKEGKALLSYDFQIVATPQMELMGEASIELGLQAPKELRKLTTIVSLTV